MCVVVVVVFVSVMDCLVLSLFFFAVFCVVRLFLIVGY